MSSVVHYKGTLKLIEKKDNETLEEFFHRVVEGNVDISCYESLTEYVTYEMQDTYYIKGNDVYAVTREEMDPDNEFFFGTVREDGTIEYNVRYYNGGCSFDDALAETLEKIDMDSIKTELKENTKTDDLIVGNVSSFDIRVKSGTNGHIDYDNCDLVLYSDIKTNNIPRKDDVIEIDNDRLLVREVNRSYLIEKNREYITVYVINV